MTYSTQALLSKSCITIKCNASLGNMKHDQSHPRSRYIATLRHRGSRSVHILWLCRRSLDLYLKCCSGVDSRIYPKNVWKLKRHTLLRPFSQNRATSKKNIAIKCHAMPLLVNRTTWPVPHGPTQRSRYIATIRVCRQFHIQWLRRRSLALYLTCCWQMLTAESTKQMFRY